MKATHLLFVLLFFTPVLHAMGTLKTIPDADTVLVFSPHPDDDILGCGGVIAKHIRAGSRVVIVYMTSGEAVFGPKKAEEIAMIREEEAKKGAEKLGVTELRFLRQADGALASCKEKASELVSEILSEITPDQIYIPHRKDWHSDHMATYRIITEVIKNTITTQEIKKALIFCYEVWTPMDEVTHYVDIASLLSVKADALSEHKSQFRYINYDDLFKSLNRYRGLTFLGKSYAECFNKISIT